MAAGSGGPGTSGGGGGGGSAAFPMKTAKKSHAVPTTLSIGAPFGSNGGGGNGSQESMMQHHHLGPMQQVLQNQNVPPSPQPQSQSQSQVKNQLKLLQMQQQYLLNQLQVGNVPSGGNSTTSPPLNLHSYHQLLTQNLAKLQKNKQYWLQQQAKLGGSGGVVAGSGNMASQCQLKLQQIQQSISQINQQLVVISSLSGQQNSGSPSQVQESNGLSSPMVGAGTPPNPRGGGGGGGSKGAAMMKQQQGRSQSISGMPVEGGEDAKRLLHNLRTLSIVNSGTQSSARNVSRLQQIISGSGSDDNLLSLGGGQGGSMSSSGSGGSEWSSPISPPQGSSSVVSLSSDSSSLVSTPATCPSLSAQSPFPSAPGGKSFSTIQEFKPGVPWQPRTMATEPAQLYSKESSMPPPTGPELGGGNGGGGLFDNTHPPVVAQSPQIYSNLSSPMLGGPPLQGRGFPGGSGGGSGMGGPQKYTRSNSTGSGYYRSGSGGGSGYMGGATTTTTGKRLSSPSPKYSSLHHHYSLHAESSRQAGWSGSGALDSPTGSGGYGSSGSSSSGHTHTRTYYPSSRTTTPTAQSPAGVLGGGGGGGGGNQFASSTDRSSWQQQHQQNQHLSGQATVTRRLAPPSSLPPRSMGSSGVYGGGPSLSRNLRSTPLGNRTFGNQTDKGSWGNSLSGGGVSTPSGGGSAVQTPSSAIISNSVWGANSLPTPEEPRIHPAQWVGKETSNVSKLWGDQVSNPSTRGTPSKPPGLSMNPDPASMVYGPTNSQNSDPKPSPSSLVTTPSFGGLWGQDEPSQAQKEVFSPEPTFAEWQAGKKARLSVFKLPSNLPTSPWLVIRNITHTVRGEGREEGGTEFLGT